MLDLPLLPWLALIAFFLSFFRSAASA